MNRMVWWDGLDQWRAEVSEIDLGSGRLSASGVQIGVDPLPYRLDYAVVTSSGFVTEAIRVIVKGAGWHRRLDLRRDTRGQWSCDVENSGAADLPAPGGDMSAVAGALDCDLGRSPSTNTMPVRRHNLHREPGAVDFLMAWVSVPDLSVHPSRQRYEHVRLDPDDTSVVRYVGRAPRLCRGAEVRSRRGSHHLSRPRPKSRHQRVLIFVPDLSTLLLFMAAAGIVVAIPGPNHLYIITRSMSQGRSAGLASAAGIETGTLVHIAAAALALSSIIASSVLAFSVIKYAGAAYLIYLGLRTLLRRPKALDQQIGSRSADPLWKVYREGILVNVLNPKVALFFLAFLPQFIDTNSELAPVQIIVLGLVMSLMGMASNIVYALSGGALCNLLERRPRFLQAQRYVTGTVYVGLGAAAALAGETRR